jgi:hypothetical protein
MIFVALMALRAAAWMAFVGFDGVARWIGATWDLGGAATLAAWVVGSGVAGFRVAR